MVVVVAALAFELASFGDDCFLLLSFCFDFDFSFETSEAELRDLPPEALTSFFLTVADAILDLN